MACRRSGFGSRREAVAKLMCWNLAGAQARARPMRWLSFATDPGSTAKWTCPSSSIATARTTA
jgi:hypothetical protein